MGRSLFLVYKANYKQFQNEDFWKYSEQAGFELTYSLFRNDVIKTIAN